MPRLRRFIAQVVAHQNFSIRITRYCCVYCLDMERFRGCVQRQSCRTERRATVSRSHFGHFAYILYGIQY